MKREGGIQYARLTIIKYVLLSMIVGVAPFIVLAYFTPISMTLEGKANWRINTLCIGLFTICTPFYIGLIRRLKAIVKESHNATP
jgi:hypothetical protein